MNVTLSRLDKDTGHWCEDGGDDDTDHAGGPVPDNRWVLSGPEYAQ